MRLMSRSRRMADGTGVIPDIVTDQTSAHDPLNYVPLGWTLGAWLALRETDPKAYRRRDAVDAPCMWRRCSPSGAQACRRF